MKLTFVSCGEEQLNQLIAFSKHTFIDAFGKLNDPEDFETYLTHAFSPEKLGAELANPNSFFYFVYQDTSLAAYLKVNLGDAQSEFKMDGGMELERIYVAIPYQGKGMGKRLLGYVFELAKHKNACYVWLGVWEKNTRAIAFYQKHGFKKIGSHPYYIGKDKQTDWLMQKEITQ